MSSIQLDDLPVEIFEQITQYLTLKECVQLERVNSEWRNVLRREWRRLKIVNLHHDPFFSGMIDFVNDKNDDSACADLGTVCLQDLAVKIHSNVQKIYISADERLHTGFISSVSSGKHKPQNRQVAAFLQKLSELSTPKLRKLILARFCLNLNESNTKAMTDIAQYIPLTLESLDLRFWYDDCNAVTYFCDGFSQKIFLQLKTLRVDFVSLIYGRSSFWMDALQMPSLKELTLSIDVRTDENVSVINNLDQLTDLETLRLDMRYIRFAENAWRILKTATSHDCKVLQSLKKLYLRGYCNDEQLLTRIERISALEWLHLPEINGFIDKAGQVRIMRSIGQGCANLKSLTFDDYTVEDEVLEEVADGFQNLSYLYVHMSDEEQIESFINSLSVDRYMEIKCGTEGPTEAELQDSLKSHPNIRYSGPEPEPI